MAKLKVAIKDVFNYLREDSHMVAHLVNYNEKGKAKLLWGELLFVHTVIYKMHALN